ncbi:MAG: ATP-dependent Clp protease proteolytic subunit [Sulfurimicrobium sp.]|nr:ATP-dependent Clp protease proteolytic subunit [Sulfurimicrobium sp.]
MHNKDTVFITYNDAINDEKVKNLIALVSGVLAEHNPSQIYFLFSSSGGSVNAGITLYNFLRGIPAEVVFHNIGTVDSIATCIFLAGAKRYASASAHFLFHGVNWNFGNGQSCTRKQLQEFISAIQQHETDIAGIITSRTSISQDEVLSIFDQGTSKGLDFALEKGVINKVCEVVIPSGYRHIACNFA